MTGEKASRGGRGPSLFVVSLGIAILSVSLTAPCGAVVFTNDSAISATNFAYDNQDIIVDRAKLTIDGPHTFATLTLTNQATLTHTLGAAAGLQITVGALVVSSNSAVEGYALGAGFSGTGYAGGSHGGRGGDLSGTANGTHGELKRPGDLGSGGYGGTRGGGKVRLTAGSLQLDGQIRANGQTGSSGDLGGGSGGSVWLEVGTLTGLGTISANGGNSANYGGGGGGGRVAIYCDEASGFDLTNRVHATGGNGYYDSVDGAAGTIYLEDRTAGQTLLRVDNETIGNVGAVTEVLSDGVNGVRVRNSKATFQCAVTADWAVVTNSVVVQSNAWVVTDLSVMGGSWKQAGATTAGQMRVSSTSYTQLQEMVVGQLSVAGGVWVQNGAVTVSDPWLRVTNVTWTQNATLLVSNLSVTGGSWDQNTNLTLTALSVSNGTWTQDAALNLQDLSLAGGTFTVNAPLAVSGSFTRSGVNLVQNAPMTLPADDLVVDGWTWTLNTSSQWDQVQLVNTGKLTHGVGATGMWLVANTVLISRALSSKLWVTEVFQRG